MKEGNEVMVFDGADWFVTGDVGDNSCFWKPAVVLRERSINGEQVVDVQFKDGRISNGHFKEGLKKVLPHPLK